MAQMVPVDYDPFSASPDAGQGGAAPSLVPVDHDPFAHPGAVEDVAKSVASKGAQGLISRSGIFGDASRGLDYGMAWLAAHGADKLGLLPKGKSADDLIQSMTSDYEAAAKKDAQNPTVMGRVESAFGPTTKQLTTGLENAAGSKFYQPQTPEGKYAGNVAQFLTAGVNKGDSAKSVITNAVIPGVASEAAGQATEGSKWEPAARLAAAVLSSGAANYATGPSTVDKMTASATRGASDADITAATQLMRDAQGRGVQLTWPEALQQVTNSATQAGRLQRIVEGTPEGGGIIAPAMAQRPQQVGQAVNATLDRIAPVTGPTQTATRAQNAAQGGIDRTNQAINAAESPYYQAANTKTVPPQDLHFISQDPAFQTALQNVRGDAIRNKDIASFGANEVPTLIAVRKELARMEQNALSPGAGMNPDRELARGITPIRDRLDQIITTHAPEYGQALGVGAGLREQVLDPLKRGPVGQIAQSENLPGQIGALFPAKPMEGTAGETSRAVQILNSQDATAAPALARQHLASTYAEAAQNNIPGANQWGGAKWAAQVAGNPLQRQTLDAGLSALPNGAQVAPDVRGLLQVLEATGKREAAGSKTAFNASDLKDMGSAGLLASVVDSAKTGTPLPLLSKLKDGFDRARLGARSEEVARGLLADPEEAARIIRQARKAAPEGRIASGIVRSLLSGPAMPGLAGR